MKPITTFLKKTSSILILVFLLGAILRLYNISNNPPALTWDEASWGYNAYTLSTTGRDEFGKILPITYLESFGDFKPPMYAYLSILPVMIFGLTEFSIRFASAFFGSLTILLTYFLMLELFPQTKRKNILALLSSFILAISPWHILLSRAAFEANVATFFIVLGILLFLVSTRDKKSVRYLVLSLTAFVCAMYTFNTSRVFLPLFVPILFVLKRKLLLSVWKKTLLGIVPAFLVSIPLLLFLTTPQAQLRYQEVNIFSDLEVIKRVNQQVENDNNSLYSKIIHNRRLAYGVEYINHYLDNFNPKFLFISGDGNPKFSVQDVGQLYIWELPFIIIGAFLIFRKREGNWAILPIWILLGIMPAATARETPHALRIETVVPTFQILTAYGLYHSALALLRLRARILNIRLSTFFLGGFAFFVVACFAYFIHSYFSHYPVTYASEWQYGYKEAIQFTEAEKEKYKNIYFTQDLGRPYIYVLLYGMYPPSTLENADVSREALGFVHVNQFGQYYFPKTLPTPEENNLYIQTYGKVPGGVKKIKTFYLPNGKPILEAYEK